MKQDKSTIVIVTTLVLVLAGAVFYAVKSSGLFSGSGEGAPDISKVQPAEGLGYTDLDGNPVSLSDFEGQTLVVNSWASWCPFCIEELPDMGRLAQEYQDREVRIIAINRKESDKTAKAFVEHVGSPENIIFWLDPDDHFYKSIGGFSMPETVFYDKDGNISFHKRGFMELEEMRRHLDSALSATDTE